MFNRPEALADFDQIIQSKLGHLDPGEHMLADVCTAQLKGNPCAHRHRQLYLTASQTRL